jgi:hypothetical protein
MRVKSKVKAGGGDGWVNHNRSVKGLRVKSNVKAGVITPNHNQSLARAAK